MYVPGDIVKCNPQAWGLPSKSRTAYMLPTPDPTVTNAQSQFARNSVILVLATVELHWFGTAQNLMCVSSDGVVGWMCDNWVTST